MKDPKTLERIQLLHPKLREEAEEIYNEICERLTGKAMCRFSFTLRTFAEQDALFAQGRTKPGKIVTKAKGGLSMHNYGLAIDVVLLLDRDGDGVFTEASWDTKGDYDADGVADWMEIVRVFKEFGWEWGGDWKFYDAPHFQKTFGKSVRELLALYKSGKVDKNNYVLI
jgi:peptidoglycan L-alanyl-D-glutamate endopeptidase CwlK